MVVLITTKYLLFLYHIIDFCIYKEHLNTTCILTIMIKIRILMRIYLKASMSPSVYALLAETEYSLDIHHIPSNHQTHTNDRHFSARNGNYSANNA